jgi:hypothetical protein
MFVKSSILSRDIALERFTTLSWDGVFVHPLARISGVYLPRYSPHYLGVPVWATACLLPTWQR